MATKTADPARRYWEKSDWEEWDRDNEEYTSKFREAIKTHQWFMLYDLLDEARSTHGYYVYPNIDDLLNTISPGWSILINLYKDDFCQNPP